MTAGAFGILLIAHGTVESLDDLPPFLANIRRGHPAPAELIAEVRRRYSAIGGKSPLLDHCRALAANVALRTKAPTKIAMRLWHPYPEAALREFAAEGVRTVLVVPLAQHSAKIYGDAVSDAATKLSAEGIHLEIRAAQNWGRSESLTRAYASKVKKAIAAIPNAATTPIHLFFSAHSLPKMIIDNGDPYEKEVRVSAEAVFREVGMPDLARRVVFQSQGMSQGPGGRSMEWLGPDLRASLEEIPKGEHVVVAPIGFLADHVEILYDLDIEASGWANDLGIGFSRTESLNDDEQLVDAVHEVVKGLIG